MENKMQIAHCIWVSEQEKKIIKENNVSVLHCPSCNLKAASGIAPITEYLREGINISIGCDTAACNDNLDQFIEMKLAALMQKVNRGATSMPAQQTFALANIEGARALNLEKRIGSLEVGKQADIVILNRNLWSTPFHDHKIYSALIYSFNGRDVDTTIVNGKILVREGKVTGFDIHELVKDAEAAIKRVTERAIKKGLYRG
jgi:cytosine/adenosine deaminase-related metal-dependent hydrolase